MSGIWLGLFSFSSLVLSCFPVLASRWVGRPSNWVVCVLYMGMGEIGFHRLLHWEALVVFFFFFLFSFIAGWFHVLF